jgi:hypothetical protein
LKNDGYRCKSKQMYIVYFYLATSYTYFAPNNKLQI